MEAELIKSFIAENSIVLIPVIYIMGMFFKSVEVIKDKYIPVLLLGFAIVLSILLNGFNTNSFIQGLLSCGVAVFFNQTFKQLVEK